MKNQYTSPALTVVTIQVERGYATSTPLDPAKDIKMSGSGGGKITESREGSNTSTHWTLSDDNSFWGTSGF